MKFIHADEAREWLSEPESKPKHFPARGRLEQQVGEVLPLVSGGFLYLFYAIFIISLCAIPGVSK